MQQIGLLALGCFVGGILILGLPVEGHVDPKAFQELAAFVLGTALAGPAFVWIGKYGGANLGDALFAYPIGLLLALLWFYVRISLGNLDAAEPILRHLAILHVIAIGVVTFVAVIITGRALIAEIYAWLRKQ